MIAPIFPLPNLVFFPHTLLPLHVFEPRYLAMTADALEGSNLIAMVQLRPNWETDYEGAPDVYDVATVGRIVHHDRLESGRFNILLQGLERIRILRELEPEGRLYRRVDAEILESKVDRETRELDETRNRLLAQCHRLMDLRPVMRRGFEHAFAASDRPDVFSDLIAGFLATTFSIGGYERQSILEEPDVARRLQLLCVQAQRIIGELIEGAV